MPTPAIICIILISIIMRSGDTMLRSKTMKKMSARVLSLILMLAIMLSLGVPFELPASAEEAEIAQTGAEEAAEGNDIVAYLKKINPSKGTDYNLELVFANKNLTPEVEYQQGAYYNFADTVFVTTTYKFDTSGRPNPTYSYEQWSPEKTALSKLAPWLQASIANRGNNIRKVTFKDKIAPKSIAGWFYYCRYLAKFVNFNNLDTSKCENMTMAFWYMNTSTTGTSGITDSSDNGFSYVNATLKSLDFSDWDFSNVKRLDCFLYSTKLETLDISGMDLTGIANNRADVDTPSDTNYKTKIVNGVTVRTEGFPTYNGCPVKNISKLVYNCSGLLSIKMDGLDLSAAEYISYLIVGTGVTTLDLSKVVDPKHLYNCENMFSSNTLLTKVIFGDEDDPYFEVGSEPMYLGYPRNGNINPFDPSYIDPATIRKTDNPYRSNAVWLGSFFAACSSLETIDLQYLKVNSKANTVYAANTLYANASGYDQNNPNLGSGLRYQYNSFFANCTALTKIDNLGNILHTPQASGNWPTRAMFQNCTSLTEIDFGDYWGYLGGPYMFQNCSSLRKLDLTNMGRAYGYPDPVAYSDPGTLSDGIYDNRMKGFQSYDNDKSLKSNVFEGCTELSEITFSQYYYSAVPNRNNDSKRNGVTAKDVLEYRPADKTYAKVADIPPVGDDVLWEKIKQPEAGTCTIADNDLSPIGTKKMTKELFGDFQMEYAGTWVRISQIGLVSKGAVPALQTFEGAVGLPVDYDPDDIVDPIMTGYEFKGFYAEDENGNKKNIATQLAANKDEDPENDELVTAWAYYAEWEENTYTLKLYGNGGETEDEATEIIVSPALRYSQYYDLNNSMFQKSGYVLSGWNTRPNGAGTEYAANDSVNMLTATKNGEAKLYAQWHKPDVIITFDPCGGESVANQNYTLKTGETTYYGDLPETTRTSFTFLGWYTAADNSGTKIASNTQVSESRTLYAHWAANPVITFDANGGGNAYFDDDTTKTDTVKVYKYGQMLGVLPTPYFGACELEGWYTASTGGDKVDKTTLATADVTYYAHWGYRPHFVSNGGVYTSQTVTEVFPAYEVQASPSYRIYKTAGSDPDHPRPTLPEFTEEEGFEGWYFGNRNLTEELAASGDDGYVEIDVSSGTYVTAQWATKTVYDVTLDLDGGSLASGVRNPIQVYAGKSVEELPTPTKKIGGVEYEFLGWYDAASGGNKKDYSFTPSDDCTLYAHWAAKSLTLTFDPNGGELFYPTKSTLKIREGGTVGELPGANREGYVLDGWYTDVNNESTKLTTSTVINSSVTYYAKWTSSADRIITSSDNIYKYAVKWSSPSNEYATNIDDTLIVAPQNGSSDVSVMLFIEFDFNQAAAAMSDPKKELAAGTVQIKVPKYVFRDRDGNNIGVDNMANGLTTLPLGSTAPADPDNLRSTNFVYDQTSDADYFILWNAYPIDGERLQQQIFKISYTLTPEELRIMNGGYTDENGNFAGTYYDRDKDSADPINVNISVNQDGVAATNYDKNLGIEMHTGVHTSATKAQAAASFGWNTDWGPEPADADQYYYITWTLSSTHDQASSQKFRIEWSEDPVHEGSVVYIKQHDYRTDTDYSSGTFHTTVVTKHLRRNDDDGWKTVYNEAVLKVTWYSGYVEKIRVSKTAGAYLPYGGPSIFEKFSYRYGKPNVSRIKEGAQELILNRTGYNFLPFEIKYQEYENLDSSKVWHETTQTYSTATRTITISDGAKADKDVYLSTVSGSLPYNWNVTAGDPESEYVGIALGDADYHFDQLDLFITEYDAVYLVRDSEHGDWSEPFEHTAFSDYEDIEIWTRTEGSNTFTLFKTVKAADLITTHVENPDTIEEEEAEYGVAKVHVNLPEKTVGYQIRHQSSFYTTKMVVNPNLCLNASNRVFDQVKSDVAAGKNTLVKNKANVTVDGRPSSNKDSRKTDVNGAYPCSYEMAIGESTIYVAQDCSAKKDYAENDEVEKTQQIPAVIAGWDTSSSVDEQNHNILKLIDSGIFYDLLPAGFTVDPSTVFVKARTKHQTARDVGAGSYAQEYGKNNFPSGCYSVEIFENWQESGRTMMKVTVDTPDGVAATGYNVFFKMKTTLANILANGESQSNSVCFIDTTEDQSPPKYKNSRITTGLDDKARPYFKELDSDYTAFANGNTNCKAPNNYAMDLSSSVRSEGALMTTDKTVGLDTSYTYDVTFTNGTQDTKNIIIYDVIENSLNGVDYDWQGTFHSVTITGISDLRDATDTNSSKVYCDPKVWYCITDDPITKDDLDITKSDIWTDVEPSDEDKPRVKAIAVDCRKNKSNKDFTLPAFPPTNNRKASIAFSVNMTSPSSSSSNDVLTYNLAVIRGTTAGEPMENETLTRVSLHYAYPDIVKTAFPSNENESAENRTGVVNESTISYSLSVTNPDPYVNIHDVTVEDLLDDNLILTNTVGVAIGDEDPVPINRDPRITEYAIGTENGRVRFTATIGTLAPGETISLVIPATVNASQGAEIDNTASITSVHGSPVNIPSNTTYHVVTPCQAKIMKVDVNKNGLAGASLQILNADSSRVLVDNITTTTDLYTTDLVPGDYVLHEVSTPDNDLYKIAADIPFTIDVEGIHYVNGTPVSYVEMVDMPAYEIVFHENQPNHDDEVFKIYGPGDIIDDGYRIRHFYDIPEWAGDEYVFAGWYHADGYAVTDSPDTAATTPLGYTNNLTNDTFTKSDPENPQDYHIYAKWIAVGTVAKATGENGDTNNYGTAQIRGFGLAGVQVRNPDMTDPNFGNEIKPGGLRFVTSLSEELYDAIDALSGTDVDGVPVEYGYVVSTEENINSFISPEHYNVKDKTKYKLQYLGENVNGVDTTGATRTAETDYRYISNVNCTSRVGTGKGVVDVDHKNFDAYRLYTLVITYEGASASRVDDKVDARAYIRYYDANGMLRVFYNDYEKNRYYGGCMCCFSQISTMALSSTAD